jgi:hypothetical protein
LLSQQKPILMVQPFTLAKGVELPYDLKQLQTQLVAELKVELGKDFNVVSESPGDSDSTLYALDGVITGWRPGKSGKKVVERKETIRTNFYSQGAGSSGTLAHPIALKIAERIKDAKLK